MLHISEKTLAALLLQNAVTAALQMNAGAAGERDREAVTTAAAAAAAFAVASAAAEKQSETHGGSAVKYSEYD